MHDLVFLLINAVTFGMNTAVLMGDEPRSPRWLHIILLIVSAGLGAYYIGRITHHA